MEARRKSADHPGIRAESWSGLRRVAFSLSNVIVFYTWDGKKLGKAVADRIVGVWMAAQTMEPR